MLNRSNEEVSSEINQLPSYILRSTLGAPIGRAKEGVHAGSGDEKSGIYHCAQFDAGRKLYVKQDKTLEKNLVEWVFYQTAVVLLSQLNQADIVKRLSPIVLVVPQATGNKAQDIYVGSVAHEGNLAWEDAYKLIDDQLPAKRAGGFEYRNQELVRRYVSEFSKKDNGFEMIAVLRLLGHYATHLANLIVDKDKKLLFFDFGAAAWYDLINKKFDQPNIRGTTGDFLMSLVGFSKDYATYYGPALYSQQAFTRLRSLHTAFGNAGSQNLIQGQFVKIMQDLSQIIDSQALKSFAAYLQMPARARENTAASDLPQKIGNHLFECLRRRIGYIPRYLEKNSKMLQATELSSDGRPCSPTETEGSHSSRVPDFLRLLPMSKDSDVESERKSDSEQSPRSPRPPVS